MQDLLVDHLVEHPQKEGSCFSLTCAICRKVWRSTSVIGKHTELEIGSAIAEEAMRDNRMCTFCGRPVCLNCFEDVEGISLCVQCGQKLRERLASNLLQQD